MKRDRKSLTNQLFLLALVSSILGASAGRAAQLQDIKPEKSRLEVAIAATGPLYLPLLLAADAGYFARRDLQVNLTQLSATASAQALLSGMVDI